MRLRAASPLSNWSPTATGWSAKGGSPRPALMDEAGFTRDLENAYRRMLQ